MPRDAIRINLVWQSFAALAILFCPYADAATVWSGFTMNFVKADDADPVLLENQDRLTDDVWLTRSVQGGIYNIHDEEEYNGSSPAGTEWATALNNTGAIIAASNWASLTFDRWITAYGGPGGMTLPTRLLTHSAVLHLIASDVYLDLQFTGWTAGAGGGGFAYDRGVPEPSTATSLLAGLIAWRCFVRR